MEPYKIAMLKNTQPRFKWETILGTGLRDWCYTQFREGQSKELTLKLVLGEVLKRYSSPNETKNNFTPDELRSRAKIGVSAAYSEWKRTRRY